MKPPISLPIDDFDYELPNESIAYTPAPHRSGSKLLVWDKQIIAESTYHNIAQFISEKSAVFFNNSKVIAARIHFQKANNSNIEIFCLEPSASFQPMSMAMQATQKVEWICLVGGAKKWKEDILEKKLELPHKSINIIAKKIKSLEGKFLIEFSWNDTSISFSEIIQHIGTIPLPPYIQRDTTPEDTIRYQTTYAKEEGSVAAPTAGLHFNEAVFDSLTKKNCSLEFISLHVGAGTFMPVKTKQITDHEMHAEVFEITITTLTYILEITKQNKTNPSKTTPIIAVGTTTLRTLESLYWLGVKLIVDPSIQKNKNIHLTQWEGYTNEASIPVMEALNALIHWMQLHQISTLITSTQLMIMPGYSFKIVNGLVTNFHQPKSTLLLIIAAITGEHWKYIYEYALKNNYRFLSYGDGCLFKIN